MEAFPAFYPLAGRRVIIAGEGPGAESKARLFEGSPAEVVLVRGEVALRPATYEGACLAFVSSPDPAFREAAAAAAKRAHTPVNVVDHPAISDFHTPAVIDRGAVVAAVGTAGAAPMLASLLRAEVEVRVPEGAGRVAALLRRHQQRVRQAFPDLAERRSFLRGIISGPAAEAAMAGRMDEAGALLEAALERGPSGGGGVSIILAETPDLVSLRGARALGAADVVFAEGAGAELAAAHARRDAERLGQANAETLLGVVRQGRRVALAVETLDELLVRRLEEGGASVDVFRPAPAPTGSRR